MSSNRRKQAVKPPTEDQWNFHKALLQNLYRTITLSELMAHMERNHGFIASKNQYERKLRDEWKSRKNLSSAEWQHALRTLAQRDKMGRASQMTLLGVPISDRRIKKERARYTLSQLKAIESLDSSMDTSQDICVYTPPSTDIITPRHIRTDNLPFVSLLALLNSQKVSLFNFQHWVHSERESLYNCPSPLSRTNWDNLTFQSGIPSVFSSSESITDILDATPNLPGAFLPSLEDSWVNRLRYQTLERHDGDTDTRLQRLFGVSNDDASNELFGFVVQLSSNGMLNQGQIIHISDLIAKLSQSSLQMLFRMQDVSVRVFLDCMVELASPLAFTKLVLADLNRVLYCGRREELLRIAIRRSAIEVINALLEEGINVNARLSHRTFGDMPNNHATFALGCTFLGIAKNAKVVEILIEHGAHLDAIFIDEDYRYKCTAIQHAAISGNTELVKIFLEAGAQLDTSINRIHDAANWWESLLGIAVKKEDIELLTILLERGAVCYDKLQSFGDLRCATELQQASYLGFTDAVKALLRTPSGVAAVKYGDYRWAPLRDAARNGHYKIVQLLIDAGVDVNATSAVEPDLFYSPKSFFWKNDIERLPSTALMAAVEGGHIEVVKTLIKNHVHINAPAFGRHGIDILNIAENLGFHDICILLEEAGATKYLSQHSQYRVVELWLAVIRNDIRKIRHLIGLGVDAGNIFDALNFSDGDNNSPVSPEVLLRIFFEVCLNDIDAIGPRSGVCALDLAINLGQEQLVKDLIHSGAKLSIQDSQQFSILQRALSSPGGSSHELIAFLLEHGAKVNWQQSYSTSRAQYYKCGNTSIYMRSPINFAVQQHDLQMIRLLQQYGADLNLCDQDEGETPLQLAIHTNRPNRQEVVEFLLGHEANINAPGAERYGRTALQAAVSIQPPDFALIQMLLGKGANINSPASEYCGRTALQIVISQDAPDMKLFDFLLDNGASINAPPGPERGLTALQVAAIQGHLKIAYMLLEKGADPNAARSALYGRTALEGAAEMGRLDMVQLLLNAGAKPTTSAIRYAEDERNFIIANLIRAEIDKMEG